MNDPTLTPLQETVLRYLRDIAPASRSDQEIAAFFDVDRIDAHWALSGLDLAGLARAGRGKSGATIYSAVKPRTWIAWTP